MKWLEDIGLITKTVFQYWSMFLIWLMAAHYSISISTDITRMIVFTGLGFVACVIIQIIYKTIKAYIKRNNGKKDT